MRKVIYLAIVAVTLGVVSAQAGVAVGWDKGPG